MDHDNNNNGNENKRTRNNSNNATNGLSDSSLLEKKRLAFGSDASLQQDNTVDNVNEEEEEEEGYDSEDLEAVKRLALGLDYGDGMEEPALDENVQSMKRVRSNNNNNNNNNNNENPATRDEDEDEEIPGPPRTIFPGAYRMAGDTTVVRDDDEYTESQYSTATTNQQADDTVNAMLVQDAEVEPTPSNDHDERMQDIPEAPPAPQAIIVKAQKLEKKPWYKVRRIQVVIAIALLVIVAVVAGVVLAVELTRRNNPPPPPPNDNNGGGGGGDNNGGGGGSGGGGGRGGKRTLALQSNQLTRRRRRRLRGAG